MKYNEACRKAREEKNITLREIAEATGYSVQNVCNFEHGRTNNAILYHFYLMNIITSRDMNILCDDVPEIDSITDEQFNELFYRRISVAEDKYSKGLDDYEEELKRQEERDSWL